MKHNELSLDQLQQIKGGSKFWGEDCSANVGGYYEDARETIGGVDNHVIMVCTYTCQNYVFGFAVGEQYQQTGGCTFDHFEL